MGPKAAPVSQAYKEVTLKAFGIAMVCSYLTKFVGTIFKQDNLWFRHRNKQLLNQLVEANLPLYEYAEKVRRTRHVSIEIEGEPYGTFDSEELTADMQNQVDMVANFVEIFLKGSNATQYELNRILEMLLRGERVYNQNEVRHAVKFALRDTCGLEATDELADRFI